MKQWLLALLIFFPMMSYGQQQDELYAGEWRVVDSLMQRGLPESAAKKAALIYKKAKDGGQEVQMMKAQLYMINAGFQRSEEGYKYAIQQGDSLSSNSAFPQRAIWESITAELYWSYYQQNRWKILERTSLAGDIKVADFEQWDAKRFYEKVTTLYVSSLSRARELEQVPIERYNAILIKGKNTRELRPSLFDLLAFRALAFFENDEKDVTKPAFAFTMNDPKAFAAADVFMETSFKTRDSGSLQARALGLYASILRLHRTDANKAAFIDADLQRLAFVYSASVLPNKRELYQGALEDIEHKYAGSPLSAMASVRLVQLMMHDEGELYHRGGMPASVKAKSDYPAIKRKLEAIIAKHPGSEGEVTARQLLQQVLAKELNVTAEEVALPGEPSKVLLNYRNISTVFVRIIKLDRQRYLDHINSSESLTEAWVREQQPVQQSSFDLPGVSDYDRHRLEFKVDPLPAGIYGVLVSSSEDLYQNGHLMSYTVFQVSGISVVKNSNGGFVLDRKTGMPLAGMSIDLMQQKYLEKESRYIYTKTATIVSARDGNFTVPKVQGWSSAMRISGPKDSITLPGYFNGESYQQPGTVKPEVRTFFFTDRSIYRPGQTIFYKGIMIDAMQGGRKNTVLAGKSSEVTFYDANGQKIGSSKVTTNEYGSFTGSFTAPQGTLTGDMHISNGSGEAHFSVEEYKRPKFAVSFDTLKDAYMLNESIVVKGNAKAYAGNAVDGAVVKYRVVRNVRFPYWWYAYRWGFPQSPEMEVTNGAVQTDSKGVFSIPFNAMPDLSVAPESMPVFTYTVTADVTDINGETRSNTMTVNAGYTSLQLSVNAADRVRPEEADTLTISSVNLNGQFVATDLQLSISRLKSPEQPLRKRLWEVPDQFLMDSVSFKSYFPIDVYKNEDEHAQWPIAQEVFQGQVRTTREGRISVPLNTWSRNGWYVIEVTAKDRSGRKLTERKYVQVWGAANEGGMNEALTIVPAAQTTAPGKEAVVRAMSGYRQLHLIREVHTAGNGPVISQEYMKGMPLTYSRLITEADRGGVMVNYITVKENRVYNEQAYITVPWTNKDLDVSWETHRDKLMPGEKEQWTMVIKGSKKEHIAAEMVAGMYDASLDVFRPHGWSVGGLYPNLYAYNNWEGIGFGQSAGSMIFNSGSSESYYYEKSYDVLIPVVASNRYMRHPYRTPVTGSAAADTRFSPPDIPIEAKQSSNAALQAGGMRAKEEANADGAAPKKVNEASTPIVPRTNLRETAFFYPQLKTDAAGNVRFEFTMPEALTEWKLMAFAHTKDMSYGMTEGKVKTQKDLMVMPNLPRFLRQGDDITISAKISNLSDKDLMGTATLEVRNAVTMQPVNTPFRLTMTEKNFTVVRGQSTTSSWSLHIPESIYEPVVILITARSGNFTDGEENTLPVITNRMLVTETLPMWMNGSGTKTFVFDKLKYADTSKTLTQHALTLEYTGNPAWYAVKALPYLMEYPYECAEQTFNRYYATALAAHIIEQSPKIKAIFDKWKAEFLLSSFSSPLNRNEELKSALLEETPWVLDAQDETEQRKRLGELFDAYKLASDLDKAVSKLRVLQSSNGAFGWFKGMYPDRYITQYIITGIGRLQQLGVKDGKGAMNEIVAKALPYLDNEIKREYNELIRNKAKMQDQHIGHYQVQYLYMRSFFTGQTRSLNNEAYSYYKQQAVKYWPQFNAYAKGMIALALHRANDKATPQTIIQSLKETALHSEEMGMYWKQPQGYWWYEAPIETQSLLIACFKEVAGDNSSVDEMKRWLLKNKQTQNWSTTKATADACYALLLTGSEWLTSVPMVTIKLGDRTVNSKDQQQEAGSGYFKTRIEGKDVNKDMGNISLAVAGNANSASWGAVYWQYFEDMDRVSGAATSLEIRKQLFVERNTDRGPELEQITGSNTLKVGDKVKVRIELFVDRDMEYVHLKDMRGACFEPVNVLSGYKYQGGLGYYESTKDVSTNFFFDHLRKGKYVFEYPVFVSQQGVFSNGIASIQCMYAPEFSSHSAGMSVQVD